MEHAGFKHCPVDEAYQYASPLISVDLFKQQCVENIKGDDLCLDQKKTKPSNVLCDGDYEEISTFLHTDIGTISELEEVCNIEHLKCEMDDKFDYNQLRAYADFPDDLPLQTVKLVKQGKTKQEELNYAPNFCEPPDEDEIGEDDALVDSAEVLIRVSVYQGHKKRILQEFYVLPQQKLTDLRDLITCPSDNVIYGEFSDDPDLTRAKPAKDMTESSFFFIEQCFYNDTRNPLNRDYSRVIIDWAKASERYTVPGLGLFTNAYMQTTTFKDLKIRLGYPYLFCHQGNCEHLIVFTDMRIICEEDPRKLASYPYKIFQAAKRARRCSVCKIHLIKWMTVNDPMAFENPSFFCEKCFRYLHYTKDGQKMATFQAYPHFETDEIQ